MKFVKIFLISSCLLALYGCTGAAISVEETDGRCVLAGGLLSPTVLDQPPAETECLSTYMFVYQGEKCSVEVKGNCNGAVEE